MDWWGAAVDPAAWTSSTRVSPGVPSAQRHLCDGFNDAAHHAGCAHLKRGRPGSGTHGSSACFLILNFFSFQQLVVVKGEVMVGHRLLVASWELRPLLFSFRCLSTGSCFLGDYPPFPRLIMFTFAAFCYMLSLVLCVSLIFFAIWHVSIFKSAFFIALRGSPQSLFMPTQRLRCDACAQWCWTFRRPRRVCCIFRVCRDVWAEI